MTAPSSSPTGPGCDRPAVARPVRGVIRWARLTPDCPIVDIGPTVLRMPRKPARRIPESPSGPSLPSLSCPYPKRASVSSDRSAQRDSRFG
jgi:hypothetical protein